ncbi:hypothetical protein BBJ28_00025059 [Nothophytophthora sp. Chile5]|nr:hypothetical protein BBJ28_00025059 [Nothophytophthora sp. Chile5]
MATAGFDNPCAKLVAGWKREPSDGDSAEKRIAFLDVTKYYGATSTQCIYAVNTTNPDKENLLLRPKHPIELPGLHASGLIDWKISRSDRMLVVIEEKQCDIRKGQHQLLAMM